MTREEYVIESILLDKKFLRNYLSFTNEEYQYPCMITLSSASGRKQYYVERSNVKGHGQDFLIIDWGSRIKE